MRSLSDEESDAYQANSGKLLNAWHNLQLITIVSINKDEFYSTLKKHLDDYVKKSLIDEVRMQQIILSINRALLNYLTSMRTLLDHTETRLKRTFGGTSVEVNKFKQFTNNAFDSSLSYRFLYKLRNYTQHCGMPFSRVDLDSTIGDRGKETAEHQLLVLLNRDELLKNFDSWGPVKTDLEKMPSDFSINNFVTDTTNILTDLNVLVLNLEYPELREAGKQVLAIIKGAFSYEGYPCIIERQDFENPDKTNFGIDWPPLIMLQHLKLVKIKIPE